MTLFLSTDQFLAVWLGPLGDDSHSLPSGYWEWTFLIWAILVGHSCLDGTFGSLGMALAEECRLIRG